ncbi:MAG: DUF1501 domain-containing protein [Isosphaeraceae bacterium]
MFRLHGPRGRLCDGRSRRSFLQVGALALGGLALPDLLRLEANAGAAKSKKSVILIYLTGGLSHQDTFDLKMDAPAEIRGEFRPIASRVPGVSVCEWLPLTAASLDKIAVLRAVIGQRDEHSSFQSLTGHLMAVAQREGKPHIGSVISKVQGPADSVVPPFVDLSPVMQHKPYNSPDAGLLGTTYNGARLGGGDDLALVRPEPSIASRVAGRRELLASFDQFRRRVDSSGLEGMDSFYDRAFQALTSNKVANALDVAKEDPRLRDRYGIGSDKHLGDGAPMWNDQFLIARRLVEAGARCVTVAYGFWDTHGNNFKHLRQHLPLFDKGVSALVEDIYARGLDRDVSVVVCSEFGRTPKINKDAGRDHWAPVACALMSGGGMNVGQVIGATDKQGGQAVAGQVHYQDILATVYHNLGIDPQGFILDKAARPIPILPGTARPIGALVG